MIVDQLGVMTWRGHDASFAIRDLAAFTMEDAYRILERLARCRAEVLAAMVDYGLSDDEIARYFDLPLT